MEISLWQTFVDNILNPLGEVRGKIVELLLRIISFAFISSLILFIVGFIVYLISLIPIYSETLPFLVIYLLSVFIAYKILIFNPPSLSTTIPGAIFGGVLIFMILLLLTGIFQIVKIKTDLLWLYPVYIVGLTILLSIVYWIMADMHYSSTHPYY